MAYERRSKYPQHVEDRRGRSEWRLTCQSPSVPIVRLRAQQQPTQAPPPLQPATAASARNSLQHCSSSSVRSTYRCCTHQPAFCLPQPRHVSVAFLARSNSPVDCTGRLFKCSLVAIVGLTLMHTRLKVLVSCHRRAHTHENSALMSESCSLPKLSWVLTMRCSHCCLLLTATVSTVCCAGAHNAPHTICTSHNLHLALFAPHTICTSHCLHLTQFAPRTVCTSHHLHLTPFAPRTICTSHHLHLTPFAPHTICTSHHLRLALFASRCLDHALSAPHDFYLAPYAPHTVCLTRCA